MKRIQQKKEALNKTVYYHLIMLFGLLVRSIGRKSSTAIANFIGSFAYHFLKIRRPLVEKNLALTFPEKKDKEIRAIAHQVYRNQAENFIEILRLPMIKTAEDAAKLVDFNTGNFLEKTILSKKGGVIVSAHFGNWELFALCGGLMITPVAVVVKQLNNSPVDLQINAWRTMHGNTIVYDSPTVIRQSLKTLRQGGIIAILGDQSDQSGSFFTEFLGRRTSVFLGPAFLALKAGVPLFVGMCHRNGDGRYTIDFEEISMAGLGTTRTDAEKLVRRYTKVIERSIYQYPEEWLWLHNRWKRTS